MASPFTGLKVTLARYNGSGHHGPSAARRERSQLGYPLRQVAAITPEGIHLTPGSAWSCLRRSAQGRSKEDKPPLAEGRGLEGIQAN